MVTESKKAEDIKPDIPWHEHAENSLITTRDCLQTELSELEKTVETESNNDSSYQEKKHLHRTVWIGYLVLQILVASTMVFVFGWGNLSDFLPDFKSQIDFQPTIVVLTLQAIHLFASLRTIGVDELAGLDLFGEPIARPEAGLHIVPFFILTITRIGRNYADVRFPGNPDKIVRFSKEQQDKRSGGDVPEGDDLPDTGGFVRPIYVQTGAPVLSDAENRSKIKPWNVNPHDRQMNIEISYFVRYRPDQRFGGIFRLTRNVKGVRGQTIATVSEAAQDLMREQSERDIKAIIATQTHATIIKNLDLVNEVFTLRLQIALIRLGINLDKDGAGLVDINLSHETNEAQQETVRAEFERQTVEITANGERRKLELEGEGTAAARKLLLIAQGIGFKRIMSETGVDGDAVLASETLKKALPKKTVVIGAKGVEDIFGLVTTGKKALGTSSGERL